MHVGDKREVRFICFSVHFNGNGILLHAVSQMRDQEAWWNAKNQKQATFKWIKREYDQETATNRNKIRSILEKFHVCGMSTCRTSISPFISCSLMHNRVLNISSHTNTFIGLITLPVFVCVYRLNHFFPWIVLVSTVALWGFRRHKQITTLIGSTKTNIGSFLVNCDLSKLNTFPLYSADRLYKGLRFRNPFDNWLSCKHFLFCNRLMMLFECARLSCVK